MASLVQSCMHGVTTTHDTTRNEFYVIKFISEAYALQNNTQIDGQVISAGELVVKEKYLFSTQENSNWYWKQHSLQQNIIVPKRTILQLNLDNFRIIDIHDICKTVCKIIQ